MYAVVSSFSRSNETSFRSFGDAKAYQTAKRRRNATSDAVFQLADLLPLPPDTDVKKLKTNDVLRLTVGFMRLKHLLKGKLSKKKAGAPPPSFATQKARKRRENERFPLPTHRRARRRARL